ncbi:CRE-SUL-2 protein [Aphelenchoides avenae]|nr:CRE-SUL-2 protein [Aphelenchus avenae]
MAWAVGEVIKDIKRAGIEKETLVVFMSDHVISALDLYPTFKKLAYRDEEEGSLVEGKHLDGVFAWPELLGYPSTLKRFFFDTGSFVVEEVSLSKRRPIFFYCNKNLMAVRYGNFKVHFMASLIFKNFSIDPKLEENCPGGKPLRDWYVSQTCPEKDLMRHEPPLVYVLHTDPYELYPIPEDQLQLGLIATVKTLIRQHKASLLPVMEQLGRFNETVVPCCNPTLCSCDYLNEGLDVGQRRSLYRTSPLEFPEVSGEHQF